MYKLKLKTGVSQNFSVRDKDGELVSISLAPQVWSEAMPKEMAFHRRVEKLVKAGSIVRKKVELEAKAEPAKSSFKSE